jgi:hypothetical protein
MSTSLYWNGEITYSAGTGNKNIKELTKMANKKRIFELSNSTYRELVSAVLKMNYKARNKLVFLTATFAYNPTEVEARKIWLNFLKNLKFKKTGNYVWTKEKQESGRIHYHIVCDLPFLDIRVLQETFNNCVKNVNNNAPVSANSLRLPHSHRFGNIISNPVSVAKYIGKYFSKSIGVKWECRCYAISCNLFPLKIEISTKEVLKLQARYKNIQKTDGKTWGITYLLDENIPTILRDFTCFDDRLA